MTDMVAMEVMRTGFGKGLVRAGELDDRVVVLSADLAESTQVSLFAERFPERYVEVGVAEQNLVTVASGLAHVGYRPFAASYAAFSPGRNWEQIRTTIAINSQPVVVIGTHAGLSVGPDGATHQALEDIALMRVMPNMQVFAPGDAAEAEELAVALVSTDSPAYVRLPRDKTPMYLTKEEFVIGQARQLRQGRDVLLVGTGTMSYQLLQAAKALQETGVSAEVLHLPTIKPLDSQAILQAAERCGRVVVAEEAQVAGGFGSAVAELLSEQLPMPVRRIGVQDRYGQSGSAAELFDYYGLTPAQIAEDVQEFINSMPKYHQ